MATSFLTRFLNSVRKQLGDPSTSKRLTDAQLLNEMWESQVAVWERLLGASGQESVLGRAESIITLRDGVARYGLPGNFRQFLVLEKRTDPDDPDTVTDYLNSLAMYDPGPGVEILDAERGMLVKPVPTLSADEDWTLVYQKGEVVLHNATAARVKNPHVLQSMPDPAWLVTPTGMTKANEFTSALVGEEVELFTAGGVSLGTRTITNATADAIAFDSVTGLTEGCLFTLNIDWGWLVAGTPASDGGELIALPDYYNGSMIRVYSATIGAPQSREVLDYYQDASSWVFKTDKWTTLPTGTVCYEVCPALPPPYDGIYAIDVTMRNLGQRSSIRRKAAMLQERKEMWNAARNYLLNNVADRAPERTVPALVDVDPYEDS